MSSLRVLGVDPGLTRCGVGIVEISSTKQARLIEVAVIRSSPGARLEQRLLMIADGIEALMEAHRPHAVAIERVFAQQNLSTVMGVAQISGIALHLAAKRGLPVGLHTPSEVKAAVTGYGSAGKKQVATMVARVLGLAELPTPADASDALAIAICHGWRPGAMSEASSRTQAEGRAGAQDSALTPAQQAWLAAERSAAKPVVKRRLAP